MAAESAVAEPDTPAIIGLAQHVHLGEAAANAADHDVGEFDETLYDAAGHQDVAAEDEERQRQQRIGVHAGEHALCGDARIGDAGEPEPHEGEQANR